MNRVRCFSLISLLAAGGLFACHTHSLRGVQGCPVLLTPWSDIATSLEPPLRIETSHDPRK